MTYIIENPVCTRQLVVNLRTVRAFAMLFGYLALLGSVVYLAWPSEQRIHLTNPEASSVW